LSHTVTCHARLPSVRRLLLYTGRVVNTSLPAVAVYISLAYRQCAVAKFGDTLISPKTQRSIGRGKPVCKKSARSVQSFRYYSGVWRMDRRTHDDS